MGDRAVALSSGDAVAAGLRGFGSLGLLAMLAILGTGNVFAGDERLGKLFGAVHYPVQGLAGVEQATITGLAVGTIFAVTGRIWMLIVAHAAFDVTALAIIYWDVEEEVAHLLFR
jgi:hypothetical protein